jgi:serine/threonine protein kinase
MGEVQIERLLGEGSCGSVYLGRHQATNRLVAVKEVRKDGSSRSGRLLSRLDKEAKIMSTVHHKYICQYHGRVESDDGSFLIMEYAKGGDLLDYINSQGAMPEKRARLIFKQLLQSLQFLHQSGYVHRVRLPCATFGTSEQITKFSPFTQDVKPENVFLTENHKSIKLGDFGFAARWRPDRTLDACVGTFPYTAPEVLDQRQYVGPEVDAWSCGTVLLAMLTARIPFAAPSKKQSLAQLRKGEFTLPAHVSPRAADLLSHLLQPDPLLRYTIEDALRHPWVTGSSRAGALALRQLLAFSSSPSPSGALKRRKTDLSEFVKAQKCKGAKRASPGSSILTR